MKFFVFIDDLNFIFTKAFQKPHEVLVDFVVTLILIVRTVMSFLKNTKRVDSNDQQKTQTVRPGFPISIILELSTSRSSLLFFRE
jgi:hypothetical protein